MNPISDENAFLDEQQSEEAEEHNKSLLQPSKCSNYLVDLIN